jgi:hypothetical protein
MSAFLIPVKCFCLPVWLMARAVHFLTASPDLQALQNSKMDKNTRVIQTYHQIRAGTKPSIVSDVTLKKNDSNNTRAEIYDPHHCRTLFVRFPRRVKDKMEVKMLYPGIEAVRFKPRIKRYHFVVLNATQIKFS